MKRHSRSGKPLTFESFADLAAVIYAKHRFGLSEDIEHSRNIKYIYPVFDTRTGCCFQISFKCLGPDRIVFNYRDSADSMQKRITMWLDGADPKDVDAKYHE